MKYRKKPVIVEAVLFAAPWSVAQEFCPTLRIIRKPGRGRGVAFGVIPTLEGDMRAEVGDYIIRGVQGEFYPCKPDIFEATYELFPEPIDLDAGPLGSGHSPRATGGDVGDCGGSVEDPSTHLIHGPASAHESRELEHQ